MRHRFFNLWRAYLHSFLEHLDNRELLLRNCWWEMNETLSGLEGEISSHSATLRVLEEDERELSRAINWFEGQLQRAIAAEHDERARELLRKRLYLRDLQKRVQQRLTSVREQQQEWREALAQCRRRLRALQARLQGKNRHFVV